MFWRNNMSAAILCYTTANSYGGRFTYVNTTSKQAKYTLYLISKNFLLHSTMGYNERCYMSHNRRNMHNSLQNVIQILLHFR